MKPWHSSVLHVLALWLLFWSFGLAGELHDPHRDCLTIGALLTIAIWLVGRIAPWVKKPT